MACETDGTSVKENMRKQIKFSAHQWAGVRTVFFVNVAICSGLFLLSLLFAPRQTMANLWEQFLGNFVYSNSIGFLAAVVIPPVALRIGKYSPTRRWLLYIPLLVLIGAAGALIANAILVVPGVVPAHRFAEYYIASVRVAVAITVLVGTGAYLIEELRHRAERTTLELRNKQFEHERALKLAMEARLNSLESRLKPHFLFNTINSVLSLIREDPQAAEEMLSRLSRLLRFSLDTQEHRQTRLAEELRLVEDYLAIERTRFGNRLRFSVDAPAELSEAAVPPYAVQTLVENSMKYAVAPRREGGEIRVKVTRREEGIEIEVSDNGPGFAREAMVSGHGLDSLEKRLETLYGAKGRLVIGNSGGGSVRLVIPESTTA